MDSTSNSKQMEIEKIEAEALEIDDDLKEETTPLKATEQLPELKEYSAKNVAIKVAAGAILGSLSIIIGFSWDAIVERIGSFGPSFAPGMTWVDFLAIPIIVAFLIFGLLSGFIAAIIGCGAIAFYLSEAFGWLAMIPKFVATVSMFFFPWLALKIMVRISRRKEDSSLKKVTMSSEVFSRPINYAFLMVIAILGRGLVMFALNTLVIAPIYVWLYSNKTEFSTVFTNPTFYLSLGGGYAAWNLVQGIFDATLSYLIVYPTKFHKHYATW